MAPCLLADRDEMTNLYRGQSIDASYEVSVYLGKGFRRSLKCKKLTDDRRQLMAKAHIAFNYKNVGGLKISLFMHTNVYFLIGPCAKNCVPW